jgi:(p)ppGpp synthase/HD superfamily hydrolase
MAHARTTWTVPTAAGHFSFLHDLPLAAEAFEFTAERHAGQVRAADSAPFLLHPLEVGALLHVFGYPERVVAAGLLHDILESSDTTAVELRMRFGSLIARLVEAVSENPAVRDPVERKARLRRQVAAAGGEAAAIFAADKLAKVREIRIRAASEAGVTGDAELRRKLDHYIASSRMLEQELGAHPVVKALAFELEALQVLPPSAAPGTPRLAFTSL